MSEYFILPTREAFSYFNLAEYSLTFYEDGLQGLIRDHVLMSDPLICDNDEIESILTEDPLQQKIVECYQNSFNYTRDVALGLDETKLNAALELSSHVRSWVNNMMRTMFLSKDIFTVQPQHFEWLGSDLVVRIDIFWD